MRQELRHVDPWRKGNGRCLADEGRGENCEETELFQKQPKPSLQGSSPDFRGFWGPLACSLQKKKKKKNLLSANISRPRHHSRPVILTDPIFSKNMEPWSHDPNHEQA